MREEETALRVFLGPRVERPLAMIMQLSSTHRRFWFSSGDVPVCCQKFSSFVGDVFLALVVGFPFV